MTDIIQPTKKGIARIIMQEFVQSKEPVEYGEDEHGCDKYHQQKDDAL